MIKITDNHKFTDMHGNPIDIGMTMRVDALIKDAFGSGDSIEPLYTVNAGDLLICIDNLHCKQDQRDELIVMHPAHGLLWLGQEECWFVEVINPCVQQAEK